MTHRFTLIREEIISDIHVHVRIYSHPSGATFVSVHNDDENKVFAVNFRTLPADSTGIAHILEHSVLCGSTHYPVKSPFIELVKGSLNTFLNAMTYPDKTIYPVASTNLKDLYNLVDVYMDAVFHPILDEDTLRQEGWRYEFDENDKLTYKGVVFNEMKGASATPERAAYRALMAELLPDTVYAQDSGGDPLAIPSLTYADFIAFHRTHYHPSNALLYWYGDDDVDARLTHLEKYLTDFTPQPEVQFAPMQQRWTMPRRATAAYQAASDESRHHVISAWLIDEPTNPTDAMELAVVSSVLLGKSVSPLQKLLRDSNFGEDLSGGGFDNNQHHYFTLGLKGVRPENIENVFTLVNDAINTIINNGVDQDEILATINSYEFQLRELNFGGMPRGLGLMMGLCDNWLYQNDSVHDILDAFRHEEFLATIKSRLSDPKRIPHLLTQLLTNNMHKLELVVAPDATLATTLATQEQAQLAAVETTLTSSQKEHIRGDAERLRIKQETPDSAENLRTLPRLTRLDIDEKASYTPLIHDQLDGVPVTYAPLQTNGIVYFTVAFSLAQLSSESLSYLPIFTRALSSIGAGPYDAVKLSQQIDIHTGGIDASTLWGQHRISNETHGRLVFSGRATVEKVPELLTLIGYMANTPHLHNRERILQIVKEDKASRDARLLPSGHVYINTRLRARYTTVANLNEQLGGITYLQFIRDVAAHAESRWDDIHHALSTLHSDTIHRSGLHVHVTCSEELIPALRESMHAFINTIPTRETTQSAWPTINLPRHEALLATAPVNYVGVAASLKDLGYTTTGADIVVNRYLSQTYLHEYIREKGGAYGAFSVLDMRTGILTMLSYRDPNVAQTLDVYANAGTWLQSQQLDEETLLQAIIGAAGDLDSYMIPSARGMSAFVEYLNGIDLAYRQHIRDQALRVTNQDFVRYGAVIEQAATSWERIVLGSESAVQQANTTQQGLFAVSTKVQ